MRVAITGASGFVGSNLMRSSVLEGLDLFRVDLRAVANDFDALGQSFDGCDAVIHLAAIAHRFGNIPESEYQRVNARLPVDLARAAADAGVTRFVFLSTSKVTGAENRGAGLSEGDPPAPVDPYSRAKLQAELELADFAARTSMRVVSIRPPIVYGPGVKANFAALVRLISRMGANPFNGIETRRSLLYVENLAAAIRHLLALQDPPEYGVYHVADSQPVALEELGDMIVRSARGIERRIPVPRFVNRSLASVAKRHKRFKGLFGEFVLDTSAIESTGYQAPYSTSEGVARTVEALTSRE